MTIQTIITTVGIPTIVVALIYIGRKLQVLDTVEKKVDSIYDRFIKVEERVNTIWKDEFVPAKSPRQLNDRGRSILNNSGIKQIIDTKKDALLEIIKAKKPTNAYDAEQVTLSAVNEIPKNYPDLIIQLKDGAFKTGQSIDILLLVGGFYLRDLIFSELGFSLTEIDKKK